jgi:hypothetical protein
VPLSLSLSLFAPNAACLPACLTPWNAGLRRIEVRQVLRGALQRLLAAGPRARGRRGRARRGRRAVSRRPVRRGAAAVGGAAAATAVRPRVRAPHLRAVGRATNGRPPGRCETGNRWNRGQKFTAAAPPAHRASPVARPTHAHTHARLFFSRCAAGTCAGGGTAPRCSSGGNRCTTRSRGRSWPSEKRCARGEWATPTGGTRASCSSGGATATTTSPSPRRP